MKVNMKVIDEANMKVELCFINNTQRTQFLNASYLYLDGESVLDQFHFTPREGVRYVGAKVKRVPESDDDIVVLGPAERYYTEVIELKNFYKFTNRKRLRVRYSGHHPLEGIKNGSHTIESNWANLDFSYHGIVDFTEFSFEQFTHQLR